MSSAILGILWSDHWPMLAIFAVVAVVGALAGLLNGLLVTRLGLPSLAVTIARSPVPGIALIILGPKTISSFRSPIPTWASTRCRDRSSPTPRHLHRLAVIFGVVLHFTPSPVDLRHGRQPDAARFAGIRSSG